MATSTDSPGSTDSHRLGLLSAFPHTFGPTVTGDSAHPFLLPRTTKAATSAAFPSHSLGVTPSKAQAVSHSGTGTGRGLVDPESERVAVEFQTSGSSPRTAQGSDVVDSSNRAPRPLSNLIDLDDARPTQSQPSLTAGSDDKTQVVTIFPASLGAPVTPTDQVTTFGTFGSPSSRESSPSGVHTRRASTGTFGYGRDEGASPGSPERVRKTSIQGDQDCQPTLPPSPAALGDHLRPRNLSITSLSNSPPTDTHRTSHWLPETEEAIVDHLENVGKRNSLAIPPAASAPPLGPRPSSCSYRLAPPLAISDGTPLRWVREESEELSDTRSRHSKSPNQCDEDDDDFVYRAKRRSSLFMSRRSSTQSSIGDDRFGDLETILMPHPGRSGTPGMARSIAGESDIDGYAESMHTNHTNAPLMGSPRTSPPPLPPTVLPKLPAPAVPTAPTQPRLPPALANKTELSPSRRMTLVKRTRKIEKVLGEALPENHAERYVVEPALQPASYTTRVDEDVWPDHNVEQAIPEWRRKDCQPQRTTSPPPSPGLSLVHRRSMSALARTYNVIRAAVTPPVPTDLRVYVGMQESTVETVVQRDPLRGVSANRDELTENLEQAALSPTISMIDDDPEKATRRRHRVQLAKLQRILGSEAIPAISASPAESDESLAQALPPLSPPTLKRQVSDSSSLGSLRGRTWSRIFERPTSPTSGAGRVPPAVLSLGVAPNALPTALHPVVEGDTMTHEERHAARRRVCKLEKVFGDVPPHNLCLPARSGVRTPSPSPAPTTVAQRRRTMSAISTGKTSEAYRRAGASPFAGRRMIGLDLDHRSSLDSLSLGIDTALANHNHSGSTTTGSSATTTTTTSTSASTSTCTASTAPRTSTSTDPESTFESFRHSIQGLIYLVEHDPSRLATIVDELDKDAHVATSFSTANADVLPSQPLRHSSSSPPPLTTSTRSIPLHERRRSTPARLSPLPSLPRLSFRRDSLTSFWDLDSPRSRSPRSAPRSPCSPPPSSPRSSTYPSSPPPTPVDPNSLAARVRRRGKLSHYFGEAQLPADTTTARQRPVLPISLSDPTSPIHEEVASSGLVDAPDFVHIPGRTTSLPALHTSAHSTNPAAQGPWTTTGTRARRRETLDGVVAELWRSIQRETRCGRLAELESAALTDLLGTLRRKRESSAWSA